MKGKISLNLVSEFDGMFSHSKKTIGKDNATYCVLVSEQDGSYILDKRRVFSNKPFNKFKFIDSFGVIRPKGKGNIQAVMGKETLYVSESGWYSVSTQKTGQPMFYALDLDGNVKWENSLDGTYSTEIIEISNKYILISSFLESSDRENYIFKLDKFGKCLWKIEVSPLGTSPIVDHEDNIYIKHGSNISKYDKDGAAVWNINLNSDSGFYWDEIICNNEKLYYGYQKDNEHFLIQIDTNGNITNNFKVQHYTSNPVINFNTNILYFRMASNNLVAFDPLRNQVKYQVELGKSIYSTPIVYKNYLITCYEKQLVVYSEDLNLISKHRLKGIAYGTNITEDGTLQVLTCDYQSWDSGKSKICYSRIYELKE